MGETQEKILIEQAKANLRTAIEGLAEASRTGLKADDDEVRHLELVRDTCAIQVLELAAGEQASELVRLNRRRHQLLASLAGFIAGDLPKHASDSERMTRLISAALLVSSSPERSPTAGEIESSARCWRMRFGELINGTKQ